jgi:hypothetical protein
MTRFARTTFLALLAISAAAVFAPSAYAVYGTNDIDTLASAFFVDGDRYLPADSEVVEQPQISDADTTKAPTTAWLGGPFNGFPASGPSVLINSGSVHAYDTPLYYQLGNPDTGQYKPSAGAPDHGVATYDVTTLKFGFNVPDGSNCVSFSYRIAEKEDDDSLGSYNEGLLAQLDTGAFTVADANGFPVSAAANFATVNGGTATDLNFWDELTPLDQSTTSMFKQTPTYTASTSVTPGNHALYLSVYDTDDSLNDDAAQVAGFNVAPATNGSCAATGTPPNIPPPPVIPTMPSGKASIGKAKEKNGFDQLSLTLTSAGTITAYDAGGPAVTIADLTAAKKKRVALVKKIVVNAAAAGPVTLTIKPTSAGKKLLKKRNKFKVRLAIVFKAAGATTTSTNYKSLTIKTKKKH